MNITFLTRAFTIFCLLLLTFCIDVEDGIFSRLGMQFDYGIAALVSLLVATLLVGQKRLTVSIVIAFSFIANMPPEFSLNFGLDRDLYLGIATATIFAPLADRVFE